MKAKTILNGIMAVSFAIGMIVIHDVTNFKVQKYQLKSNKVKTPYRFVVLADLHDQKFGKYNKKLLKAIEKLAPEAVYVAGDMITAYPGKDYADTLKFLKMLAERFPVYYGSGNHEYRMRIDQEKYKNMSKEYEHALKDCGITRIFTGSCDTNRKEVKAYGIEIDRMYYRKFEKMEMPKGYTKDRLGEMDSSTYNILIAHNPEYFENYAETGADLVLAGHVHGGIAQIPFIGGVISPKFRLFPRYTGGLYKSDNSSMILSRGLGCHTIPIRFLNPCELVYVEVLPE